MSKAPPLIVWFREDLRLADNPALAAAAQSGRPVIAVYILDETQGVRAPGAASRWWLDKSLASLAADLHKTLGGRLILRRGPALAVLEALIGESGATTAHWNRLYEPGAVARDKAVKAALTALGVECRSFNAALLNEPWRITKGDGGDYRVFTPYWRAADAAAAAVAPCPSPRSVTWFDGALDCDPLPAWNLHPRAPDWSAGFGDWRPGESGAKARLDGFLADHVAAYAATRDAPAAPGTSRLSPHLHFGEIGPRQVYSAASLAAVARESAEAGVSVFQKELGWREFNHHVLFHHPAMTDTAFKPAFEAFPWRDDAAGLRAWRRGRTGYPIVDAGMRELWVTGWMHNRVRMIVASFLTKHLMIEWRQGEAWFWDTLVDADMANNVAGWQWVAGSGADAAPYFRIFNPVLQGATHDPDGAYVRRWLPQLARLPSAVIHEPWKAGEDVLRRSGVRLGIDYPRPIVDHALARERALAAHRSLGAASTLGREPAI
jgi:deoxyribodipyrimidine photo-lyase